MKNSGGNNRSEAATAKGIDPTRTEKSVLWYVTTSTQWYSL